MKKNKKQGQECIGGVEREAPIAELSAEIRNRYDMRNNKGVIHMTQSDQSLWLVRLIAFVGVVPVIAFVIYLLARAGQFGPWSTVPTTEQPAAPVMKMLRDDPKSVEPATSKRQRSGKKRSTSASRLRSSTERRSSPYLRPSAAASASGTTGSEPSPAPSLGLDLQVEVTVQNPPPRP